MAELAPISPGRAGTLVGLAMALAGIGSSATSVALPSISRALDLGPVGSAWILGAFVIGVAVSAPVYGRLSDRFGSRWPFAAGLTLLAVGSVIAAVAWHPAVLYLGRALSGIGAGAVPALSGVLLASRFDDGERSEALARCGALSAGSALGVLIGGTLDSLLGWRAVLLLPVVIVVIAPTMVRIAPSQRLPGRTDVSGIALVALSVVGLVMVLQGSTSGAMVAAIGAAALCTGVPLVLRHTKRHPDGLLPAAIVEDRVFITTGIAGMAVPGSFYAALVLVPATLVRAYGWSPSQIGLALLPAAVIGVLAPRVMRRSSIPVSRLTPIAIAMGGAGLLVAGLAIDNGYVVAASFTGVTVCFGFAQGALVDRVSNYSTGPRGAMIGTYTLLFFAGGAISSGLAGLISAAAGPRAAYIVLAGLMFAGAVLLAATWRTDEREAGRSPAI